MRAALRSKEGRLAAAAAVLALFAVAAFAAQWRVESATVARVQRDAEQRANDLAARLRISYEGCKAGRKQIGALNHRIDLFRQFVVGTARLRELTAGLQPNPRAAAETKRQAALARRVARETTPLFAAGDCEYLNPDKHFGPPRRRG